MTEMLERVAQALYDNTDIELATWKHACWEETTEYVRDSYRKLARAAIEAMREPTDAMRGAGYNICPGETDDSWTAAQVWYAMIDAALDNPPPK